MKTAYEDHQALQLMRKDGGRHEAQNRRKIAGRV
jgi:hypothetical protein